MPSHRAEQLDRVAFDLGMNFSPEDEWGLINYLEDFKLFRRGMRRRISNILHRQDNMLKLDLYVFDYRFTVSTGKSARVIRQTVFFVQSKELALPIFRMRPENLFHRVGEYLGLQDIDFEEHPAFSRNYRLHGPDEDYIRASVNEPFFAFFSVEKKWFLEGINYYMVFYRKGKLLEPKQIKEFYRKGMKVYRSLARQ